MTNSHDISTEVDRMYQRHAGQLTAACSSYFGMLNLTMAEDVVQDTFVAALSVWKQDGIPKNPKSWLYKVCKHKSLNLVAKNQTSTKYQSVRTKAPEIDHFFLDHEIQDQHLRWLFAAAIPSFSPRMRIIFMLKAVHGIKVREIASLLLLTETSVQKMYERAKTKIKDDLDKSRIPDVNNSKDRLLSVLNALYLVFTLGYDQPWKIDSGQDLCYDALELTKSLVLRSTFQTPETYALYSLMLFQTARLPARLSAEGIFLDLEHQDRNLWNKELIQLGIIHLNKSQRLEGLSKYHLEATIASIHCTTKTWSKTPWDKIGRLYSQLDKSFPSPFVKLNHCISLLYAEGYEAALTYLKANHFSAFSQNYQYHATLSRIYQSAQIVPKASYHLDLAIRYARDQPTKSNLQQRSENLH